MEANYSTKAQVLAFGQVPSDVLRPKLFIPCEHALIDNCNI
jgi:hypothetical protein